MQEGKLDSGPGRRPLQGIMSKLLHPSSSPLSPAYKVKIPITWRGSAASMRGGEPVIAILVAQLWK